MKICGIYSTLFPKWVSEVTDDCKYFEFAYKQGRGHFKIDTVMLITGFNQTEFKKVVGMIGSNDNPQILAGYLNSIIKKIYDRFNKELKENDPDKVKIIEWLNKRNDMLVKAFNVSTLIEEVKEVQETPEIAPVESNENLTPFKKCNVVRYIPTQLKPIWENGTTENHIGYHFEYRGMPLQAYTTDGWCKDNLVTTIFIVDPVIGLPITHYDGALCDIEDVLAGVFMKYLQTIENHKEAIVQIARAFSKLKEVA